MIYHENLGFHIFFQKKKIYFRSVSFWCKSIFSENCQLITLKGHSHLLNSYFIIQIWRCLLFWMQSLQSMQSMHCNVITIIIIFNYFFQLFF